jgi:hypothetical protein
MLRKTYTILAVTVVASASAACGGTVGTVGSHQATTQELTDELSRTSLSDAVDQKDYFGPLCDGDGYPLPGNINSKEAHPTSVGEFCSAIGKGQPDAEPKQGPSTTPPTPAPTPAPAPPACDKNALSQELSDQLLESALTNHTKYRCLCDDEGYPLVGNINAKATTVSVFCKALKDDGLL